MFPQTAVLRIAYFRSELVLMNTLGLQFSCQCICTRTLVCAKGACNFIIEQVSTCLNFMRRRHLQIKTAQCPMVRMDALRANSHLCWHSAFLFRRGVVRALRSSKQKSSHLEPSPRRCSLSAGAPSRTPTTRRIPRCGWTVCARTHSPCAMT